MATAVLDSLVETVSGLPEQDARAVLDFARFLSERRPSVRVYPHVEMVYTPSGRRARIRGSRVMVSHIVGYIHLGETPESIADRVLPFLTRSQVYDALAYYDAHRAEIDRELAENTETASMARLREHLGQQDFDRLTGNAA
ncbi:MAG TPA: DUF433 domain-containing protein [Anaerolineae bacterium]|nr:DUF433 domain-containing protein [Anaerolineae bacterium]